MTAAAATDLDFAVVRVFVICKFTVFCGREPLGAAESALQVQHTTDLAMLCRSSTTARSAYGTSRLPIIKGIFCWEVLQEKNFMIFLFVFKFVSLTHFLVLL